uniref:Ig-like domain-containing protein n=1 Tax=Macrostomum lignano TaxID=282301 RepID=A0A1I8H8M2_9PLAT
RYQDVNLHQTRAVLTQERNFATEPAVFTPKHSCCCCCLSCQGNTESCSSSSAVMAQLLALCALCAALCALGGAASSIKFNITTTNIAASWQSSEYNNRCFRDTAVLEQWDYFHTTDTPDSHGNQWLLIKLSRAIRVQSVTVYGRAAVPSRAQNIEILLSDRLPSGLNASNGSCYGTLSGSLSSLTQCGVTKDEQTQTHKVACSYSGCPKVTEYILLRKNVRNESDKYSYMNFQALEVEEASQNAQIYRCEVSGGHLSNCRLNALQTLKNGDRAYMKVCSPCQLPTTDAASCHIAAPSGNITQLRVNGNPDFFLIVIFIPTAESQGGNFTCNFNCSNELPQSATEPIGFFEEKPRSVSIEPSNGVQLGSRIFLASGMEFHFSFITEAAYPSPIHACRLVRAAEQETTEDTSGVPLHPVRERSLTDASSNKSHAITKISEYRLNISAHMQAAGQKIQCVSTVGESSGKSVKPISLPELVVPSKPEFLLPPITDWKDGHSVSVAVDSTTDSPVPTSHRCLLETRDGNRSLTATQVTNKSCKFELDVDRHWGNAASLVCLVNQSGLIQTWTRHRLPKVLYKAEGLAIRISSGDLVSDEEASFSVTASDSGYPAALHQCRIESKSLGEDKTAESDGSSHWRFTPQRGHNGEQIRCDVVQKLSGSLIFSQTVNSSNLEVKYKANVTWPSNIPLKKEREALSFVVLADGNPEPSSQCWLQLISGAQVDLHKLKHSMFESTFNVTVDRSMNRANLSCVLTQPGLPSSTEQRFTQLITVFYQPQPPLTIGLAQTVYEGTDVTFTVRSGAGNPTVNHRCHVYNGTIVSAIFAHQIT